MEMRQSQKLQLGQKLQLQQVISLANTLSMPVGAMDSVLEEITKNPERTEQILKENESEGFSEGTQAIYGDLCKRGGDSEKNRGGVIIDLPLKNLERVVHPDKTIGITPDVRYIGIKGEKPKIIYAKHLHERPELKIQISSEFEKTIKCYGILLKQRDWITTQLRDIYIILGAKQREFIESLDPTVLHIFNQEDLRAETGISVSSVSRLINNKYVLIESANGIEEIYLVKNLMPNSNQIKKYQKIPKINKLLSEEFEKGVTYSDQDIAKGIGGTARRTVAKYRKQAGIPNEFKRKIAYQEDPLTKFRIPCFRD